jgi:hypothetical protein
MRGRLAIVASLVVLASASSAGAVELMNDTFVSGGSANFQGGFVAGEAGASRFVAPAAGRQLQKIHFLFGGMSTATRSITINVYDDTAGTDAPGAQLYTMDYQVTGSDMTLQEVDVTAMNVIVPQQFRIAIVFQTAGFPSIADDTGPIAADKNYILANGTSWVRSQSLGLTGNWILRAVISDVGGGGGGDAGPGGGGGGTCHGNGDCPSGEYCDLTHNACTFDCRSASDCTSGTCNSLGQCIGGKKKGCAIGGGGEPAIALAIVCVLVLSRRRARRR